MDHATAAVAETTSRGGAARKVQLDLPPRPARFGDANASRELNGIPKVDFPSNLQAALSAGNSMADVLREVVALRRGPGKLTPNEYFYYRLWDPSLRRAEKRRFIGKQAQHPMHLACNHTGWYAAAADKLLFQTVMAGAGLPTPELLAVTRRTGTAGRTASLATPGQAEAFLREPSHYPLFAKPVDGKYSLAVLSADRVDRDADRVTLRGEGRRPAAEVARQLLAREGGFVIQRRLAPDAGLCGKFGPALWSLRLVVLLTPAGPVIHRAVAKIATGANPADNFWRPGNMLGAVNLVAGVIERVVRGTGAEMTVNEAHPDSGQPLTGTCLPGWPGIQDLVKEAAQVLPGIRTQSWDVALSDRGPVLLEVNFGGDLNLAQLAHRTGALDDTYLEHLRSCGYRI